MEGGIEKDCTALGGLFQTIITDMRVSHDIIGTRYSLTCSFKLFLIIIFKFHRYSIIMLKP